LRAPAGRAEAEFDQTRAELADLRAGGQKDDAPPRPAQRRTMGHWACQSAAEISCREAGYYQACRLAGEEASPDHGDSRDLSTTEPIFPRTGAKMLVAGRFCRRLGLRCYGCR
jgi:hypothetical protein